MTHEYVPSEKLLILVQTGNFEGVRAHFASYGFRDQLGHPLENCEDFLQLLILALDAAGKPGEC